MIFVHPPYYSLGNKIIVFWGEWGQKLWRRLSTNAIQRKKRERLSRRGEKGWYYHCY